MGQFRWVLLRSGFRHKWSQLQSGTEKTQRVPVAAEDVLDNGWYAPHQMKSLEQSEALSM